MGDLQVFDVDFDEFRQIIRQTQNFEFVDDVLHHAATGFDAHADIGVDEVQRHFHVDFLVLVDTLKIDVQRDRFERVHLEIAQQRGRGHAIDGDIQHRRVKHFQLEMAQYRGLIDFDLLHRLIRPVNNAGDAPAGTQAAARTRALFRTRVGSYSYLHYSLQKFGTSATRSPLIKIP